MKIDEAVKQAAFNIVKTKTFNIEDSAIKKLISDLALVNDDCVKEKHVKQVRIEIEKYKEQND